MRIHKGMLVSLAVLLVAGGGAFAQPHGLRAMGGPALSPEISAKCWDLEAKFVAADLGLSAEQAGKVAEVYKAARQGHQAAMQAKMTPGQRPDFGAMMEVNKAERAKLEAALKGLLTPEQAGQAIASLGSFNRRWDPMVATLDGMNLDEKTKSAAMKLVLGFVVESDKALQAMVAPKDFQVMRDTSRKLKENLDAEMAKALSAEQATKWQEATGFHGGQNAPRRGAPPAPGAKPAAE